MKKNKTQKAILFQLEQLNCTTNGHGKDQLVLVAKSFETELICNPKSSTVSLETFPLESLAKS